MSRQVAKRQASLAGFFSPQAKRAVKRETSPDLVALDGPPAAGSSAKAEVKDVKPGSGYPASEQLEPSAITGGGSNNGAEKPKAEDELKSVAGPSKPSGPNAYRSPPSPTYNHPFPIAPVPASLQLEYNSSPKIIDSPASLDLLYFDRFIAPSCARRLTKYLLDALPWYRVKYTVRGININTPRYTTVFGKDETDTPWNGGYKVKPRAIPDILLRLKEKGTFLLP